MGYFGGYSNYEDWAVSNLPTQYCQHCGEIIHPTSPRKKFCTWEENAPCAYDRWAESLTLVGWIHKVAGMSVKQFIQSEGIDTYNSLKLDYESKRKEVSYK